MDSGEKPDDAQILRLLVDGVMDYAIFSLDVAGNITSWNRGAERINGYRVDEAIGRHFSMFYRDVDVARGWPQEELERASALGRYEDEGWRVRKDGSLIWANVIITAIRDASGRLLGFSKVTRDLTERRRYEEQLRQREEDFRLLVEGVRGHAMFLVDPHGRIQTWNAGAQRLLGYEAGQVIGQPTKILYTESDRQSSQFELALRAATENGQIEFRAWRQRADGVAIWSEISSTALWNADGSCRGFVQIIRDLTETQRVETLEFEGRKTAEFIAMLSHELRNPLGPIRNAATLLKRFAVRDDAKWCADVIDRQVTHLARLVDDLLDVSRITSGKIRLNSQACELTALVNDAIEAMQATIQAKGHTLSVRLPRTPVKVYGDATRLTQVVVNLLTNACKYTPPPGNLEVALEVENEWAVLSVKDNGIGITPGLIDRIFEPFVQGERALDRSEGGLGVGLALVKGVVSLHGGFVKAESAGEGHGTIFTVRLPLTEAKVLPATPPAPSSAAPGSRTVLVVDDNADAADAIAMMLRLEGHHVEVTYDSVAALEVAARLRPDVAILDVGLPNIDGYELARRLRRTAGLDQTKLIALTGYGQQGDKAAAEQAGFAHHVTKPARPEDLLELVNN